MKMLNAHLLHRPLHVEKGHLVHSVSGVCESPFAPPPAVWPEQWLHLVSFWAQTAEENLGSPPLGESAGLAASWGRQIQSAWRNSPVPIGGTLWMTLQDWEVEGNAVHPKRLHLHHPEVLVYLSDAGPHSRTSAARKGKEKFWMGVSHPVEFWEKKKHWYSMLFHFNFHFKKAHN